MCAYNRVNGVACAENTELLGILREEWGFDGLVMSDWAAVHDLVKAIGAGLDLEMHGPSWWTCTPWSMRSVPGPRARKSWIVPYPGFFPLYTWALKHQKADLRRRKSPRPGGKGGRRRHGAA